MKVLFISTLCFLFSISTIICQSDGLSFDEGSLMSSNYTPTYEEMVSFYKKYADEHPEIALYNMGQSDYGKPIYLCVLNAEKDSLTTFNKSKKNTSLLINNGIHPGEPTGINACMQLVIEYAKAPKEAKKSFPVTAIIPSYNIGGMINRNGFSRANQDGPEEYGFRGNTKNLDLNRDFIKMDSDNTKVFKIIFHAIDPEIFIDTHTTNGADYQYVMTYIVPLYDRMPKPTRDLLYDKMLPYMEKYMPQKWNFDISPYVVTKKTVPDSGLIAFDATPRYAMGYADLFNSISFTTETHMLKPFEERVRSTYSFILESIAFATSNSDEIYTTRKKAFKSQQEQEEFKAHFVADTSYSDSILFKGYEHSYKESKITEQERLFYDRNQPFEKFIPYQLRFKNTKSVKAPKYYILGGQEKAIIERLKLNKINFNRIENDSLILKAKQIKITAFSSLKTPYEGHFYHDKVETEELLIDTLKVKPGDILIPVNQKNKLFIVSVLDPIMEDSYFRWNFFDSYLMQKEYFSPYVFEDFAEEFLENNPKIEAEFREKQKNDSEFSGSRWQQMYWIYKRSPYFERSYMKLPLWKV